jgi:hypothetical protein
LRDDFREVGVPTYSLVRGAEISEPIELSLASLRKKCRGKVRVCTGDDAEGGIMESKDVGGCDPVEVNRRLVALRSNPEKVETIDALELTESGREEGEGICGSTINPASATARHTEALRGRQTLVGRNR